MPLVFLVTGSSRGLGRAIVDAALDAGHRVVATARRPMQLDELVRRYAQQIAPIAVLLRLVAAFGGSDRQCFGGGGGGRRLTLAEDAVEVCAPDTHATADTDRRELPLVDPVANRLLVELQVLCDLLDRQVFIVPARAHAN